MAGVGEGRRSLCESGASSSAATSPAVDVKCEVTSLADVAKCATLFSEHETRFRFHASVAVFQVFRSAHFDWHTCISRD